MKTFYSTKSEIILFKENKKSSCQFAVHEFVAYLKSVKHPEALKFSYCAPDPQFILDLSILQNIMLDYSSPSLTENKESHFKNLMKWQPNFHMETLFNSIKNIQELPLKATNEELKLAQLIKSFLTDRPFIFLENPEKHLSEKSLHIFKEALKFQKENYPDKIIFIKSNSAHMWNKLITKTVYRHDNYSFHTELNEMEIPKNIGFKFRTLKKAA